MVTGQALAAIARRGISQVIRRARGCVATGAASAAAIHHRASVVPVILLAVLRLIRRGRQLRRPYVA